MKGWVPAYRKMFSPDHWLAPTKRDPASRLHAWLDLCQMAVHEPMILMGVKIPKGCTRPLSVRFLADRWKWSKSRVARFLSDLEASTAIETVTGTGYGTVYRIVNYDTYAAFGDASRDASGDSKRDSRGTAAGQSEQYKPSEPTTGAPRRRKSQLPESWRPGESHAAKAKALRLDLAAETEGFRLHAKANGRVQLDWDAAFHMWLRKSAEFKRGHRGNDDGPHWSEELA